MYFKSKNNRDNRFADKVTVYATATQTEFILLNKPANNHIGQYLWRLVKLNSGNSGTSSKFSSRFAPVCATGTAKNCI